MHAPGESVPLDASDAHKIVSVLRMRGGDAIEAIDSASHVFEAALEIDGRSVRAKLGAQRDAAAAGSVRVTIAQAVPKAQKMDFIVEKCTELGAAAFVPLVTQRTVAGADSNAKRERWKRLARTAAMQCGRESIPDISQPHTLEQLAHTFAQYDCVLFPWELAPHEPVRETLEARLADAASALVVVGPEGGFSHEEAQIAQAAGAHVVWLGPRILRTETAGMVVLAFVNLLRGG